MTLCFAAVGVSATGISIAPSLAVITPEGVNIQPQGLNIQPVLITIFPVGVNVQPQVTTPPLLPSQTFCCPAILCFQLSPGTSGSLFYNLC